MRSTEKLGRVLLRTGEGTPAAGGGGGGRDLRLVEMEYKATKIKSAVRLYGMMSRP